MSVEDSMKDILGEEIVRELLTEINEDITDDEVAETYRLCNNNPWSAPTMYRLLTIMKGKA